MIPKAKFITIDNNQELILKMLEDMVLMPRIKALEWSKVTKQTPNMKIGYPGQHLASLVTGVEGARTGARGDDLKDGTEVKSCSKADQLDTCKKCKEKVLRSEEVCPHCGSDEIKRMDDSKWLFTIRSLAELKLLTEKIDRIFLTLADYPYFKECNYDIIRFQAFEIWNNNERHRQFKTLMVNYYNLVYLGHKKKDPNKTPAAKNFWPYSYQFYMCNPVKVFECLVTDACSAPKLEIRKYVEPHYDRSLLRSEDMPSGKLNNEEMSNLLLTAPEEILSPLIVNGTPLNLLKNSVHKPISKKRFSTAIPFLNEEAKNYLKLRDTDIPVDAKTEYRRR
jgi:predicted RNA-binding Zn-ribbon protein involved in translation (DUF1610 family)